MPAKMLEYYGQRIQYRFTKSLRRHESRLDKKEKAKKA